jgi:hypothetical protein
LARWFLIPAARTPIRACRRSDSSNVINAIGVEEELEAAQSKASKKALVTFFQVRQRARLTFQSGFVFRSLGLFLSFLFCSPRTLSIN